MTQREKRVVSRGNLLMPFEGGPPAGFTSEQIGPRLYLGNNRWFLSTGEIVCTQRFHRKFLLEIKRRWWKVL